MKRLSGLLCTAVLGVTLAATMARAQVITPIAPIKTGSGAVAGKVLPSGVKAWFGVPFAKAPTGPLRWQPPQPSSWQGVWNADRKMPECIQVLRPHNINHYFGEEASSEDCLYLNIWAPPKSSATAKLPVVVFIYGGGGTIGSSGSALYDGEQVAKHGAVFVNLNYRLGILGFMAHPALTQEQGGHSGNYGYLDQNAALKWIHDNIASFGGDPSRVLVSGQSAGAGSVTAQVFSPLSKGLFHAAFMSSGCSWGGNGSPLPGSATTLAGGEATGTQIQKLLNAASIDEMRLAPADKILALQAESQLGINNPGVRVGAIIDGWFTPKSQLEILEAHQQNDVAIMAESNGQDLDASGGALLGATTVAEYQDAAYRTWGAKAGEFLKLYPVTSDAEVKAVALRATQDAGMQGSARNCAELQTKYSKSPAYISFFNRRHSYTPGVKIADQDLATIGAYHTSDIPFWFGTLDAFNLFRSTRSWTPADRALSDDMIASLIAFAKTGNPATATVKWPAWTPTSEQRLVIADKITVEPLNVAGLDWLAAHPAPRIAFGGAAAPAARVTPRD